MYDDLISSLRICRRMNSANDNCIAYHDGSCEAEPVCMYELMDKAADAIEKLSSQLDDFKRLCLPLQENRLYKYSDGRFVEVFLMLSSKEES